jgi:hypothetical protein
MTTDAFPTLVFCAQRDLMLPAYTAVSRLAPTVLIRRPEDLNATLLDRIRPRYVLLPDWSWLIGEVWDRSAALIPGMVARLLGGDFTPQDQRPGGFIRKRRSPAMSRLDPAWELDRLYDFIRMLDDPYPNAFLDIADKRLTLRAARREGELLRAEVLIEQRDPPAAITEGDTNA